MRTRASLTLNGSSGKECRSTTASGEPSTSNSPRTSVSSGRATKRSGRSANAPHRPLEATPKYLARFPDLDGDERVYAAMVSALDDAVGEIVAAVERSEAASRTIVCFLSDNGAVAGEGQGSNLELAMGKFFLFEGGVRVPLIVHDPRRTAGARLVQTPVSTLDLAPTLLAACGIDAEAAQLEGTDLAPRLDGEPAARGHHGD